MIATRFFFSLFFIFSLSGCNEVYTLPKPIDPPLTFKEFQQQVGYQLDYDLYLPSYINNWRQIDEFKFKFNQKEQTYWLKNIDLTQALESYKVFTFKITNINWHYQFGFGRLRINNDDSPYSVTPNNDIALQLVHAFHTSNLSLELPANTKAKYVSFAIKITSNDLHPTGVLYTRITEQKI
jgi:hypothetical protein